MALFFHSVQPVPLDDRKKTILRGGNPFRHHIFMGIGMLRASLYKPPSKPQYLTYNLYQDEEYDADDPIASEIMIIEEVVQEILREVERVQGDSKVRFKDHFIVGFDLAKQLGMLYQKAMDYQIHIEENVYHAIMGAKWIDLANLMPMMQQKRTTLKPGFVPPPLVQSWGQLTKIDEMDRVQALEDASEVSKLLVKDIQRIMGYYHQTLSYQN
jgi:hypothetical protein